MKSYIIEELNVLELKTEENEDEYIDYKCEPDNREIGSVLKKAYDKKLKKEIASLSSAQLRDYLKNGSLMIGEVKIEQGWLKVEKIFKDKHAQSKVTACASNMTSSVLLNIEQDENLKQLGTSREITNRIQKLRKSSGVQIDDQIEVFYAFANEEPSSLREVLHSHGDKVQKLIRMPFMNVSSRQAGQTIIGETTYENSQNAAEVITLYVCKPAIHLVDSEIVKSHSSVNLAGLRSYVDGFSQEGLATHIQSNGGSIKISLDNNDIELKHKQHFFFNGRERVGL